MPEFRGQANEGVSFPLGGDGKRSTSATGRAIFADSIRAIDGDVAARIEHTKDWRKGYISPLKDIVLAAAQSTDNALTISRDGLLSCSQRFTFRRDGEEMSVPDAFATFRNRALTSATVSGKAAREESLSVPYQGRRLFGSELRRQIDHWVDQGIAEPSFGGALHAVLDHPEWIDLRDTDIVLLGAGAEMAPTRSLLRWGARVHAIDLPNPAIWERLIAITRSTPGTLRIPVPISEEDNPSLGGLHEIGRAHV